MAAFFRDLKKLLSRGSDGSGAGLRPRDREGTSVAVHQPGRRKGVGPKVVAVLTVRNEERFMASCLENLIDQGVEVYVCDNESTDQTLEIAEHYLGAGVIAVESIPFGGEYEWQRLLRRKEELFYSIDADWLMHVDADEIHLSSSTVPLASAIADVDAQGYDAIDFFEFTFIPTRENPDHDTPVFPATLRTYYPFAPTPQRLVRAFKKQAGPLEISWSGGHVLRSSRPIRLYPEQFRLKHYIFLSPEHAARKYLGRRYRADEVDGLGWHGWRPKLRPEDIRLPSASELRFTTTDADLDRSDPWTQHWLETTVAS